MGLFKRLKSVSEATAAAQKAPKDRNTQLEQFRHLNQDEAGVITRIVLEDDNKQDLVQNQQVSPPDYKVLAPLFPRYPIVPREEEGREQLPAYQPSITRELVVMRKPELSSPYVPATHRSWSMVYMELNNTQLTFYTVSRKSSALELQGKKDHSYKINHHLRSYTLQYGQVGLAADYEKRPYVIRVRLESEQFLLSFMCQEECISWCHDLQIAVDLALPLEERDLPIYRSIPARRRRHSRGRQRSDVSDLSLRPSWSARSSASTGSTTGANINSSNSNNTSQGRNNIQIMFNNPTYARLDLSSRRLTFDETRRRPTSYVDSVNRSRTSLSPTSSTVLDRLATNDGLSDMEDEEENENENTPRQPCTRTTTTSSTFTSFYKWNPVKHVPSRNSFLHYATRCLSSLTADAPWLDTPIVVEGKKYIVRETRYEPVLALTTG
jgi:hypothetical protein